MSLDGAPPRNPLAVSPLHSEHHDIVMCVDDDQHQNQHFETAFAVSPPLFASFGEFQRALSYPSVPLQLAPDARVLTALGCHVPPADTPPCWICGTNAPLCSDARCDDVASLRRAEMHTFFFPCRCGPVHRCCYARIALGTLLPSQLYACGTCGEAIRLEALPLPDGGADGSSSPSVVTRDIHRAFLGRAVLFYVFVFALLMGIVSLWATFCWGVDQEGKNIPIAFRWISSSVVAGPPTNDAVEVWRADFKRKDTPTWPSYGGFGLLLTAITVTIAALVEQLYEGQHCCCESNNGRDLTPRHLQTRNDNCCATCDEGTRGCWIGCYVCTHGPSMSDGGCGALCHSMDSQCCRITCCCGNNSACSRNACSGDGCDGCGELGPLVLIVFLVVVIAVLLSFVFIAVYIACARMREHHTAMMAAIKCRVMLSHGQMLILGVGEQIITAPTQ